MQAARSSGPPVNLWEITRSRSKNVLPIVIVILLLTPMVQIPSWEANWFEASQEIPRISLNPKVHYRTHKRPPPISILVQPNSVHMPTSNLLEIRPNIIHPSTPKSPHWSLSLRFPHQDPIHSTLLTHTRNMHISYSIRNKVKCQLHAIR